MKKIISILLVMIFLSSSFSFACTNNSECTTGQIGANWACVVDQWACPWSPGCPWYQETMNNINSSSTWAMGIVCNETQLTNGQCKLNIYDTLGIRKSVRNPWDQTSVWLFVQDIVLSATFFIGTLVTVALVVSWLMFIFAASSGKDPANAKKGIIGSLVGLLIVVSSYVIIRLVQYIAKGF